MYYKEREEDNTYARPVEGLKLVVDLLKQYVPLSFFPPSLPLSLLSKPCLCFLPTTQDLTLSLPPSLPPFLPPSLPPLPLSPLSEVVEFVEEMGGIRVAAPDELRYMTYTPPQLQRQVGREGGRMGGRERGRERGKTYV